MKIAALIPARAGSKRVPLKNIKPLGGKPLLFWSIDVALACDFFNCICVSTESEEVIEIVQEHYPRSDVKTLLRPAVLATDSADLRDVCTHFLEQEEHIDYLSLFMPTYPFRDPERIIDDIAPALFSRQIDRVVSVREGNFATFDYWIKRENHFHRMFKGNPLWCGAGNAAYFFQKRAFFFLEPHQWPTPLGERTLRVQTNYKESIDIDTNKDFEQAEKISRGYRQVRKKLAIFSDETSEFVAPVGADIKSFREYLKDKGIRADLPVLVLKPADPLFTFLRWYECNSNQTYYTDETQKLIARLPGSGHSQDFPTHWMHTLSYRFLRKTVDAYGIADNQVPLTQVIVEKELQHEWSDYIAPVEWVKFSEIVDK